MALGAPLVVGPVSAWAAAIVVEGCSPGSAVVVETLDATPVVVATGTAAGGRDSIPVMTTPQAGSRLVARQALGAEVSPITPSALAVETSGVPTSHAQLPAMTFVTHPYECGKALWLRGAAPGAQVTARYGNAILGTGRADGAGNARFGTDPLPRRTNSVRVVQEAPPGATALAGSPQAAVGVTLEVPPGQMPAPMVRTPGPTGCDSVVPVGEVTDGAEVTIEQMSDGTRHVAVFDLDELQFRLSQPLPSSGDTLYVWQSMAWCEHPASDPLKVGVPAAATPGPIAIDSPCAGSSFVRVTGLRGGSTLEISVAGGASHTFVVPATATTWAAPVEPLPASASIHATMRWCGFAVSALAVADTGEPAQEPVVEPPLHACGRAISVTTTPGCSIEIWGEIGGQRMQLSPRIHAGTRLVTTGVAPLLSIPESVWARQLDCTGAWLESAVEVVVGHVAHVPPVELAMPLVEGARAVLPRNALSGARVTIWASSDGGPGISIGVRDTTRADPVVVLTRPLSTRDTVWATQELCQGERSEPGPRYQVLPGILRYEGVPQAWPISGPDEGVEVDTGVLECEFATGSWRLTVHATNTDPDHDVGLIVGVTLAMPPPLTFGANLDMDLAAAGGGLPYGMASKGIPASDSVTRKGSWSGMTNPAFWQAMIGASSAWTLLVAPQNYEPVPEDPREYDEDDKPATP